MATTTTLAALPPTMRAWTRPRRGPYRTSLRLTTIPTPSPPIGSEVLIQVSYVPLNPGAVNMINLIPAFITAQGFLIPELECSGTIVAAGPDAPAELREPGTPVAAFLDLPSVIRGKGLLAEYVKIPAEMSVMRLPEGLSGRMKEAGAVTSVGQTALKMIRTAGVKAGDVVLVNGASGGVGVMVVQMCKWVGARVVGVASGANEELVRGLGADEVSNSFFWAINDRDTDHGKFVDYRKHEDLPGYLEERFGEEKLDHILDCVGTQALYIHSPKYLKPNGGVVNIGGLEGLFTQLYNWTMNTWWPRWLGGTPRRYIMFSTLPLREPGLELIKLMDEGKIRVPLDSEWNFDDVIEAYDRIESKRTRGKMIIAVRESG